MQLSILCTLHFATLKTYYPLPTTLIPTYASCRSQPPITSFSVTGISGTAPSLERNIYLQFCNRAGRNLLSEPKTLTSTGVRVTINSGAILGFEEVFWIVISCESTYNESDAAILAQIKMRNNDQITKRSDAPPGANPLGLPIAIDLTTEEHFINNRAVTTATSLPTTGMLDGAIAFVADTGVYYRYDSEAVTSSSDNRLYSYGAISRGYGKWVEYNGTFNSRVCLRNLPTQKPTDAYLASTSDLEGCDRTLNTVENALKIPPKIGAANGTAERYWFNNGLTADGESPIVRGKYTLDISIDGVPGYESVFANKIRYTLIGYINRSTLELHTAIATVGQPKMWNPTDGLITLPAQLPRNHAAVYDLQLVFNNDDLVGKLPAQFVSLSLNFVEVLNVQGVVSELAKVIGDLVFSDKDRLLIVPGLKRLSGLASIETGFIVEQEDEQLITGLEEDTADSQIVISGALNGYATVKAATTILNYSEVLRAVVSTEPGIGELYSAGNLTLSSNRIAITINHPLTSSGSGIIRSDYPDTLIAGNSKARFTATNCYIFLDLGGTKYQSTVQLVAEQASQVINLNLSDFSVIPNFPVQADNYFNLFAPLLLTSVAAGSGGFTGNATVYFAYAYISPNYKATKINHEAANTIPTARYTLAESINRSLARAENLNDLLDKAIARDNLDVHPKAELNTHRDNTNNPHSVTTTQIGAATTAQLTATNNNINQLNTALRTKIKQITANYTVTNNDFRHIIECNSTNTITLTLNHTTLDTTLNNPFEFIARQANTGTVNIAIAGGATLDGTGTAITGIYDSVYFAYKGSGKWIAIGNLV